MKPPTTRKGRTHKIQVGPITAYLTVNRDTHGNIIEIFAKSDGGMQGHLDNVCRAYSLGFQKRCDVRTAIRHLRGDRTEPVGCVGQPTSVYDAIAVELEREAAGGPVILEPFGEGEGGKDEGKA